MKPFARWVRAIPVILAAAVPAIATLAFVPPLYTDATILSIVSDPATALPHYPPGYAYFVWAMHRFAALIGAPAGPSDAGLLTMVVAQQAILVASVVYFALGCAQTISGRVLAVLPFFFIPALWIINHGLQTEALWLSSLIGLFGATARMIRAGRVTRASGILFTLALTASLLIRPTALLFAPMAPIALILVALVDRSLKGVRGAIAASVLAAVSFGASQAVTRAAFAWNQKEFVSPWGRGTIEVIQRAVWKLEDEGGARTELVPVLERAAPDPVKPAVATIIRYLDADYAGTGKASTWGGAHLALVRAGLARDLTAADRLINGFCLAFIRTYRRVMVAQAIASLKAFGDNLTDRVDYSATAFVLNLTRQASLNWARAARPQLPPNLQSLAMVARNAEYVRADERVAESSLVRFISAFEAAQIGAAAIGVLLASGLLRRRLDTRAAIYVASALMLAIGYLIVVSLLLVYIVRYALPIQLLAVTAFGFVLARTPTGEIDAMQHRSEDGV